MNQGAGASKLPRAAQRINLLTEDWIPKEGQTDLRGWEWYYLRSRLFQNPLILKLPLDSPRTRSVLSPDKSRLAAVVSGDLVCIWDIRNGHLLHSYPSVDTVSALTWHVNSRQLVLASANHSGDDHSILLWDPESSDGPSTIATRVKDVKRLRCSPAGKHIACLGWGGRQIVDLETGEIIAIDTLLGGMDWSPDGTRLATVSSPAEGVSIWDSVASEVNATFDDRGWFDVKWSPDGKRIAGRNFCDVCIWDVDEQRVLHDLRGHYDVRLGAGLESRTERYWRRPPAMAPFDFGIPKAAKSCGYFRDILDQ